MRIVVDTIVEADVCTLMMGYEGTVIHLAAPGDALGLALPSFCTIDSSDLCISIHFKMLIESMTPPVVPGIGGLSDPHSIGLVSEQVSHEPL